MSLNFKGCFARNNKNMVTTTYQVVSILLLLIKFMGFYFSVLIEMIFAIAILRLFFNFLKRLTPNKDFRFPICGLRSCVVIETASDCDYSPSFSTAFCRADTGDI